MNPRYAWHDGYPVLNLEVDGVLVRLPAETKPTVHSVANGYVVAFFLDTWLGYPKRGSYTLTIEEIGEQAATERDDRARTRGSN